MVNEALSVLRCAATNVYANGSDGDFGSMVVKLPTNVPIDRFS